MSKISITLIMLLLIAVHASAQEQAAGDVEEPETGVAAEGGDSDAIDEEDETDAEEDTPLIVDPEFVDVDLDDQTYDEDEDDFVPSEEIPADEPIPFPSNI